MNGREIPGVSRQDLKKIRALPVPLLREWVIRVSDANQYYGAMAEKELLLEALHREFGFGKKRLGRVLDRAQEIKTEIQEGAKLE